MEAIKRFANAFGFLGLTYQAKSWDGLKMFTDIEPTTKKEHEVYIKKLKQTEHEQRRLAGELFVEPLQLWLDEAAQMNYLVQFHQILEFHKDDTAEALKKELSPFLRFKNKRIVLKYRDNEWGYDHIQIEQMSENPDHIYIAGKVLLLREINRKLEAAVSYKLMREIPSGEIWPRLVIDNLYAFLWYEFSTRIAQSPEIRACSECKSLFYVNKSEKRRKSTCSDRCRKRKSVMKSVPDIS